MRRVRHQRGSRAPVEVALGRALRAIAVAVASATVALALAGGAGAAYPITSGDLSVGSSTAVGGGAVTLSGGGFEPGSSLTVWLRSDPVQLAAINADATGSFSTTVTIPADTVPGEHTLEVRGPAAEGGTLVLSDTFTVAEREPEDTGGSSGGDDDESSLPSTGLPLLPLLFAGGGLVAAGLALAAANRRRGAQR